MATLGAEFWWAARFEISGSADQTAALAGKERGGHTTSTHDRRFPQRFANCFVWLLGIALGILANPASALTLLSSNQLVFVNVDHAPMGACSDINYGYKGDICGVGVSTGYYPYWNAGPAGGGGGGVVIGLSGAAGLKILPFVSAISAISSNATAFPDAAVQRLLTPFTDEYTLAGTGVSFTHYSPAWQMRDLATATSSEKRRFFLPATWMVITVSNTNATQEDFYFGLPVPVTPETFANGAYQGVAVLGEAALAVQKGTCDILTGAALTSIFNAMTQGFAFHVNVPAGQTRALTVVVAYYRSSVVDSHTGSRYYYTTLYPSMDAVIDAAFTGFGDAQTRCQQMAAVMSDAGLNPFRRFLACDGLHSYMADTACMINSLGVVRWWEMEGIFNYINTFDLTVDHAFYDALMHPWALRNVLDGFSGALTGTGGYNYTAPLYSPAGPQVSTQGFSFDHDMGQWPTSGTGPAYGATMGDEELQSWILSAGLYWSHTADNAWLSNNLGVLQTCLSSMLLRDNTNSASRDGVTKNVNSYEITTFDSLDNSLVRPAFNGRLAVRNWACYLALNAMFNQVSDTADAATCLNMAGIAAQTVVDRWNSYKGTLGFIPAGLDGSDTSATSPMVEGLSYPVAMGLTNAIDRTGGPYAAMLQALSNHMMGVLVSGKCLDSTSGAWRLTTGSTTVWQSKIFIAQFVTEVVLGITNTYVNGSVDQIHASMQIQDAPFAGFADALYAPGVFQNPGGVTYPRGLTTAIWWLNATNNPANPTTSSAPAAPSIAGALAGDHQVLLLWQGVPFATGYNLKRGTSSGGPYTTVTNGFTGASFTDSGVNNGTTYYYILTATNQFGESAPSPEVSATPIPAAGSKIFAALNASQVTISWPASYVGWILQTNSIGLTTPAAWGDVPDSITHSQMSFPAGGSKVEFFRLRHP
jgi:hypothetical protein